jgi:hypothetical protein
MPALISGILVVVALSLSIFGLVNNKTWLVVVGAFLFLPFVYYFGGSPATRIIIVLPLLHFGSAYALYKNNKMMAWSLFSPVIFFVLFVISIVVVNQFGN